MTTEVQPWGYAWTCTGFLVWIALLVHKGDFFSTENGRYTVLDIVAGFVVGSIGFMVLWPILIYLISASWKQR